MIKGNKPSLMRDQRQNTLHKNQSQQKKENMNNIDREILLKLKSRKELKDELDRRTILINQKNVVLEWELIKEKKKRKLLSYFVKKEFEIPDSILKKLKIIMEEYDKSSIETMVMLIENECEILEDEKQIYGQSQNTSMGDYDYE
jgi:hypothetical protein